MKQFEEYINTQSSINNPAEINIIQILPFYI